MKRFCNLAAFMALTVFLGLFASCSQNVTGSISFTVDESLVSKVKGGGSTRTVNFQRAAVSEVLGNYSPDFTNLDFIIFGDCSDSKTIPLTEGETVQFENIPVGAVITCRVDVYIPETDVNGRIDLFTGKSESITVKPGLNTVDIVLTRGNNDDNSEPTATYKAIVDNTSYETFEEAFNDWSGSGNILVLLADLETEATIAVSDGTKTLDLNGYGILYAGSDSASVITVEDGAALTITDSSYENTEHYITLTNWRGTSVSDTGKESDFIRGSGVIKVTGGYITGGAASSQGGGVFVAPEANFTMKGGTIIGNTSGKFGGGIGAEDCTSEEDMHELEHIIEIQGGTIKYNRAVYGAGVSVGKTLKISGGLITENYAETSENDTGAGGGAYCHYLTMTGGSIINNKADGPTGGVTCDNDITLSGTPIITGNKNGDEANGNLYVRDGTSIIITEALGEDASIGITLGAESGMFTAVGDSYIPTENDAAKFFSDSDYYKVEFIDINSGIQLVSMVHYITYEYSDESMGTVSGVSVAREGTTVTIKVEPESGYVNSELTVKTDSEEELELDGTYRSRTFTMPAGDVVVTATFEPGEYWDYNTIISMNVGDTVGAVTLTSADKGLGNFYDFEITTFTTGVGYYFKQIEFLTTGTSIKTGGNWTVTDEIFYSTQDEKTVEDGSKVVWTAQTGDSLTEVSFKEDAYAIEYIKFTFLND